MISRSFPRRLSYYFHLFTDLAPARIRVRAGFRSALDNVQHRPWTALAYSDTPGTKKLYPRSTFYFYSLASMAGSCRLVTYFTTASKHHHPTLGISQKRFTSRRHPPGFHGRGFYGVSDFDRTIFFSIDYRLFFNDNGMCARPRRATYNTSHLILQTDLSNVICAVPRHNGIAGANSCSPLMT
jgi:hypothetical protein